MQNSMMMVMRRIVLWIALAHITLLRAQSVPMPDRNAAPSVTNIPQDVRATKKMDDTDDPHRTGSASAAWYTHHMTQSMPTDAEDLRSVAKAVLNVSSDGRLLNSTMFDVLIERTKELTKMNDGERTECEIRGILKGYFNFTTENGTRYCPAFFDEIQCWEESLPGLVHRSCPSGFRGIAYNTSTQVTRVCLDNGTWGNGNRSDYYSCQAIIKTEPKPNEHHADRVLLIHTIGSALSFVATLVALIILLIFRSLWCLRNYIHMNFLLSFLLLYVVYFVSIIHTRYPQLESPPWEFCIVSASVLAVTLANFCWMLVEGLYLYSTLVRGTGVTIKTFCLYAAIGWAVPIALTVVNVVVRFTLNWEATEQEWEESCLEKSATDYIVKVPIMIIILINVIFLIHIIVVIVRRPHMSKRGGEIQHFKETLRALIVLTPLLGAAYLLFLVEPSPDNPTLATHVYRYLLTVLQSTQGFFVALIYVFLNREVHNAILRRCFPQRQEATLFTSASRVEECKPRWLADNASNGVPLIVTSSDEIHQSEQSNGKPRGMAGDVNNYKNDATRNGGVTSSVANGSAGQDEALTPNGTSHDHIDDELVPLQPQPDRDDVAKTSLQTTPSRVHRHRNNDDSEIDDVESSSIIEHVEADGKVVDGVVENNNHYVGQTL